MSKYKANGVFESMGFALNGIWVTLKSQLNFRVEVLIAILGFLLAVALILFNEFLKKRVLDEVQVVEDAVSSIELLKEKRGE